MKKRIKISDIAIQAGVSTSTVSLVLNNRPGVSQETRSRVLKVANKLKYPIKPTTNLGKSDHLTTVGMIVKTDPDMPPLANPFYSKVIVGIEDVCRRNGLNLLFVTLPVDEDNHPTEVPSIFYNELVDGLLMVGTFVDETITAISDKSLPPIVLVDGYSDSGNFDAVVSDNFHAAYQAVEYLVAKGHRHIGLVGSCENCYPSLQERRNGYLRALKENGISDTYIANFNINKSHGYQETIALLEKQPQISALFCINDDIGSTTIKAAQDFGKRIPEDLSIIGYDDTYIAANTHPSLTTMHVDTVAMGRAAMQLLALRMDQRDSARMTLIIHPWLVERASTGVARSHP
jgi:LacI family transcriptional regulator